MKHRPLCVAALFAAGLTSTSHAQFAPLRVVIADRTNDTLWILYDANGNGVIDEPGEVSVLFSGANVNGTLGPSNTTALGIRRDGLVIMGDQEAAHRCVYRLRDRSGDGDTQDAGESVIGAGPTNASGISVAFPTGIAFDPQYRGYVVNAGNTFGLDGVYRLEDLDFDGTWSQADEIKQYVGTPVFGATNGPNSPQEICFIGDTMYLHDSGTGFQGIWKASDNDSNGRADDAGEYAVFWTLAASGVAPSAGFPLCVDPLHPRSLYTHQIIPGGIDQFIRVTDVDGDGDANDPGEAVIVYQTGEAGFTAIALLALPDGRLLVTDNSGKKVYCLRDTDGDGLFNTAGERTAFFANTSLLVGDIRQIALYPVICPADIATEGNSDPLAGPDGFVTGIDFDVFILAYFKEMRRACDGNLIADITDGTGTGGPDGFVTGTDADKYIQLFFAGC